MWSEIYQRVLTNVSCLGWFVVGAKCAAQLMVWFSDSVWFQV